MFSNRLYNLFFEYKVENLHQFHDLVLMFYFLYMNTLETYSIWDKLDFMFEDVNVTKQKQSQRQTNESFFNRKNGSTCLNSVLTDIVHYIEIIQYICLLDSL